MPSLFAKECQKSLRLQKFEALIPRIPSNHPVLPEVMAEYKKWLAGYKGEKSLVFYLSMLPETKYTIFHDLRLKLGNYFFQIDYLILCSSFALVLEVKNRSGEYFFEKALNQTTITNNGTTERIKNPVTQARLQAAKLTRWLQEHYCAKLPIAFLFVNANDKATIKFAPGTEQLQRNMCNSECLLEKISQIQSQYKEDILDVKELKKIRRLLITSHTPHDPDLLKQFNLTENDLLPGVQCPVCEHLPMRYERGIWNCLNCKTTSKTAHVKTIHDHFLLIKPTITNGELRQWLCINSSRTANRIFHSMELAYSGTFKNRVYFYKNKTTAAKATVIFPHV
ncbi:nuclease-related domain-containing protein [Neobacillus dielmonensis]|uniref:nuclease-related domain-containing protein n=1 Tax=Neobacillus dielmonensis TaxID=1347369 RepID=UPI00069364C8|nr:nuclease-related domain-containing protein [Neobacillus dielmonensis]